MNGNHKDTGDNVDNDTTIYTPLPSKVGGNNTNPSQIALRSLLPAPSTSTLPPEESLTTQVRNRALLLHSNAKPNTPSAIAKRPRRTAPGKVVLPKEQQKYDIYVPLMTLWNDYAATVLQNEKLSNHGERMLRMDLHGAPVHVVRAKDPSLVGVNGILVAETANTVIIVTKKNKAVTVLKSVAVIRIKVASVQIDIFLPALQFRASERSARKMKKRHFSPW